MSTEAFSHPTSPTFADVNFTSPPRLGNKDPGIWLKEVDKYLADQAVSLTDMQSSITQGWIIDGLRVINLTADNIAAETIFTQDLYVGSDGNGSIGLLGTQTQIVIKDENGTDRVLAGKFGASATDWGIKVLDNTGTVRFQSTSTTFIDGAILTNATITDAKIVNSTITGGKIAPSTITNSNIATGISAAKITTGTLTVTSSGVAIDVTGGGAFVIRSGGDLILKASAAGNNNLAIFQTSSGSTRYTLGWNSITNTFFGSPSGGCNLSFLGTDVLLSSTGSMTITSTSENILLEPGVAGKVVSSKGDINPFSDNAYTLGTGLHRWADMRSVLINGADFCFENGFRMTEPNHVYGDEPADMGIYFMNDDWEPIALLTRTGNLLVRGHISNGWIFGKPSVERREST